MRVNDWALVNFSNGTCSMEGRLNHKRLGGNIAQVFKERWFKLKSNILFYFNLNANGQIIETKPAGALVLEHSITAFENGAEVPFAFSLTFRDDPERKHLFAGPSEEKVNQWVAFIKEASYEFWRSQLLMLQYQLNAATGKDPLLLYPRSDGSKLPLHPQEKTSDKLPKVKGPKRKTFHSYVGSVNEEPTATKSPNILDDPALEFFDDYFGNGLNAIGSSSRGDPKPTQINGIQSDNVPEKAGNSRFFVPETDGLETALKKADGDLKRLVPVRVAPPPPVPKRPPRLNRQPTGNLIDL